MGILHYADKDVVRGDLKLHPDDHALDPVIKFVTLNDVVHSEIIDLKEWDEAFNIAGTGSSYVPIFELRPGLAKKICDWLNDGYLVSIVFNSHLANPDLHDGDIIDNPTPVQNAGTVSFRHNHAFSMPTNMTRSYDFFCGAFGGDQTKLVENKPGRCASFRSYDTLVSWMGYLFFVIEATNEIICYDGYNGYAFTPCKKHET